jgi:hypothetical protein
MLFIEQLLSSTTKAASTVFLKRVFNIYDIDNSKSTSIDVMLTKTVLQYA